MSCEMHAWVQKVVAAGSHDNPQALVSEILGRSDIDPVVVYQCMQEAAYNYFQRNVRVPTVLLDATRILGGFRNNTTELTVLEKYIRRGTQPPSGI